QRSVGSGRERRDEGGILAEEERAMGPVQAAAGDLEAGEAADAAIEAVGQPAEEVGDQLAAAVRAPDLGARGAQRDLALAQRGTESATGERRARGQGEVGHVAVFSDAGVA